MNRRGSIKWSSDAASRRGATILAVIYGSLLTISIISLFGLANRLSGNHPVDAPQANQQRSIAKRSSGVQAPLSDFKQVSPRTSKNNREGPQNGGGKQQGSAALSKNLQPKTFDVSILDLKKDNKKSPMLLAVAQEAVELLSCSSTSKCWCCWRRSCYGKNNSAATILPSHVDRISPRGWHGFYQRCDYHHNSIDL
mmetsp:Transcript_23439/g.48654  ORF Transcript_23439/g.48654 Transcript_23439/m.48654 type:complete len:196 (+) Transcript_23439:2-589(+)